MFNYVLNSNQQANGDYEIHRVGCIYTPKPENQIALGTHFNCATAVAKARSMHPNARINGCATCSIACHTS